MKPGDKQYLINYANGEFTLRTAVIVDAFDLGLRRVTIPTHKLAAGQYPTLEPASDRMEFGGSPWCDSLEAAVKSWRERLTARTERELKKLESFLTPEQPKE